VTPEQVLFQTRYSAVPIVRGANGEDGVTESFVSSTM